MSRYRRLGPLLQPLTGTSPLALRRTTLVVPGVVATNVCIRELGSTRPARGPGGPTNFDTLKVVQRLEAQGFTSEQSKAVMELLKDVIDESVMGLTRTMVTREEQDKVPVRIVRKGVLIEGIISTKSRLRPTSKRTPNPRQKRLHLHKERTRPPNRRNRKTTAKIP